MTFSAFCAHERHRSREPRIRAKASHLADFVKAKSPRGRPVSADRPNGHGGTGQVVPGRRRRSRSCFVRRRPNCSRAFFPSKSTFSPMRRPVSGLAQIRAYIPDDALCLLPRACFNRPVPVGCLTHYPRQVLTQPRPPLDVSSFLPFFLHFSRELGSGRGSFF